MMVERHVKPPRGRAISAALKAVLGAVLGSDMDSRVPGLDWGARTQTSREVHWQRRRSIPHSASGVLPMRAQLLSRRIIPGLVLIALASLAHAADLLVVVNVARLDVVHIAQRPVGAPLLRPLEEAVEPADVRHH